MAMNPFKHLFGSVKEAPVEQDALSIYLARVDQALAAIDAIPAAEVHHAQLCVPMTLNPKTQALHAAVFEAVGSMAAALEAQRRMLAMLKSQIVLER